MSVAYSDRSETEQDAIGVEVFTNAVGDAEIVQRLLEQLPCTLAQAYDIARHHETTSKAASYVTSLMHMGARNVAERRQRAAVIRQGSKEQEPEPAPAPPVTSWKPRPQPHGPDHSTCRGKGAWRDSVGGGTLPQLLRPWPHEEELPPHQRRPSKSKFHQPLLKPQSLLYATLNLRGKRWPFTC